MYLRFIISVLDALITLIIEHMKNIEDGGDCDADGVPLNENYEAYGYALASLRDLRDALNDFK